MADENEDSEDESIEDEIATEINTGTTAATKGDQANVATTAFGTGKALSKDQ